MVKLATGFDNTNLCHLFGELRDQRISNIYCYTIGLLDSKAWNNGWNIFQILR
jgi:hypothetical protein